jgi:hypothetical protein
MLKVVLKCNSSSDCRRANLVLTKYGVPILKTKESSFSVSYRITIVVSDYAFLNEVAFALNQDSYWGVQVVKVKSIKCKEKSNETLGG